MRQVYDTAGIRVDHISTESLDLPDLLDLDIGACDGATTDEQNDLFSHRGNAGSNEIVVYFVRSTVPPANGCACHPPGRPGAVVVADAPKWTLAHEVGHVLGLDHVVNNNRLMTEFGTAAILNPPPDLAQVEIDKMLSSPLTSPVV